MKCCLTRFVEIQISCDIQIEFWTRYQYSYDFSIPLLIVVLLDFTFIRCYNAINTVIAASINGGVLLLLLIWLGLTFFSSNAEAAQGICHLQL